MSITASQQKALHALIRRHVAAQIADSEKGGGHPTDWPIIEAEAKAAEEKLTEYIRKLTE